MVGYIQEAVAKAIREWEALKNANVIPVRAVEGDSIVVNTTLPAVIINVRGTEGDGSEFIGGSIRQFFDLELWVLLDVLNYTFSKDNNKQAQMLDISDDVIRCVEHPDFLKDIKNVHDFNMSFDHMSTETTHGSKNALVITVDVHKIIYNCSVVFDKQDAAYNAYVNLLRIELDNNGTNNIIIE